MLPFTRSHAEQSNHDRVRATVESYEEPIGLFDIASNPRGDDQLADIIVGTKQNSGRSQGETDEHEVSLHHSGTGCNSILLGPAENAREVQESCVHRR